MHTDGRLDSDNCYRAVLARDGRFDGRVFTAVTTTGIYCRPSCPSRTPLRANVRFYSTAAAAVAAGFRACRRCRPDSLPGSREWDHRGDLVARALRLVAAGEVDERGVSGLAGRLAVSERHLHRSLVAEVGVGPLALARTRRAQTARLLIDQTGLSMTEIAFAAGFSSIRQFNDVIREEFARTPSELRAAVGRSSAGSVGSPVGSLSSPLAGALVLRLRAREPFAAGPLLAFLAARAVDGVELADASGYQRVVRTPHGLGLVGVVPGTSGAVGATVRLMLPDLSDLGTVVAGVRRLFDLDAEPDEVDDVLAGDPSMAPLVARIRGIRVPGAVDGYEIAVRAVLGQQVSLGAARTFAARLVAELGERVPDPSGALTSAFPTAAAVATAGTELRGLGLTGSRAATLAELSARVASGDLCLDPGADRAEARAGLHAIPGIGPWTVEYVAMRALSDPDAWPATDLVLKRRSLELGLDPEAAMFKPWRAYAAMQLWQPIGQPPTQSTVSEEMS
jgi:AraC family transcriptional regulator, regulatory protein of adaptative response / DNA-3-methyladenine glycosylase II